MKLFCFVVCLLLSTLVSYFDRIARGTQMPNVPFSQFLIFIIVNEKQLVLYSLQHTKTCSQWCVHSSQPLPLGRELMELAGECPVSLCLLFSLNQPHPRGRTPRDALGLPRRLPRGNKITDYSASRILPLNHRL